MDKTSTAFAVKEEPAWFTGSPSRPQVCLLFRLAN